MELPGHAGHPVGQDLRAAQFGQADAGQQTRHLTAHPHRDTVTEERPQHEKAGLRLGPLQERERGGVPAVPVGGVQQGQQTLSKGGRTGLVQVVHMHGARCGDGLAGGLGEGPGRCVERLEIRHPVEEHIARAGAGEGVRVDQCGQPLPGAGNVVGAVAQLLQCLGARGAYRRVQRALPCGDLG